MWLKYCLLLINVIRFFWAGFIRLTEQAFIRLIQRALFVRSDIIRRLFPVPHLLRLQKYYFFLIYARKNALSVILGAFFLFYSL